MSRKLTTEEYINRCIDVYGDKYDYSKTVYVNMQTNIIVTCPIHGDFTVSPHDFIRGHGCRKCSIEKRGVKKRLSQDEFIRRVKNIHGDKYDLSNVVYEGYATPLKLICPIHGEFEITPNSLLRGCGCSKCGHIKTGQTLRIGKNEFFKQCRNVHNGKYSYNEDSFVSLDGDIVITCPKHGDFTQNARSHMMGHGCRECKNESISESKQTGFEYFVDRSRKIHGDKYEYIEESYKDTHTETEIICPDHGVFKQLPYKHTYGQGCPKCSIHQSRGETEIYEFICGIISNENVIERDRDTIKPYELDIYVPSKKLAIEYNGLIWHSEKYNQDKNRHLSKTELCEKNGIRLLQIFEDEYNTHKEIVLSKIKHILGCDSDLPGVMARKCIVKEIDRKTARIFLEHNHIQGYARCTVSIGCFSDNILVGVMLFKKEGDNYELVRFATDINHRCSGIGGKMFKYFISNYRFNEIKSFADRRWSTHCKNNLYVKLGFEFNGYTPPDYRYIGKDGLRKHKFGFRKNRLSKKYDMPNDLTEREMTKLLGYDRIYDCGLIKYVFKNQS